MNIHTDRLHENERERRTSAINNDIKNNILLEENVIKMRHEIKIHNNKKTKNKKRRADENIDVSFFFKKGGKKHTCKSVRC